MLGSTTSNHLNLAEELDVNVKLVALENNLTLLYSIFVEIEILAFDAPTFDRNPCAVVVKVIAVLEAKFLVTLPLAVAVIVTVVFTAPSLISLFSP